MFNLLRAESYKLLRNKTFWVLIIIVVTLSFLLVLLPYLDELGVFDKVEGLSIEINDQATESQPLNGMKIFLESLYSTDLFMNILFISVLGSFFVANEHANGTIKNLASVGHSRGNIFLAKWLILLLGTVIIIFSMPIIMGSFGSLFFGIGDMPKSEQLIHAGKITLLSFLYFIAFQTIVMFFSIVSRSSGVALLWTFGFYLLVGVGLNFLSSYSFGQMLNKYSVYYRYTTFLEEYLSGSRMVELGLIAIVTTGIFFGLGMFVFHRKDLS